MIFRAIQGLGGGGLMILSQAIIADIVPAKERGKYMGPLGPIFGLSAVAGPLLGGFFVDHLTWEWAFYITIPVGVAAFTIAWFTLTLPNKKAERRIDILGVLFLSLATTCLIFFTDFGGKKDEGWDSPVTWAFAAGLVLAAAAFVLVERRAEDLWSLAHVYVRAVVGLRGSGGQQHHRRGRPCQHERPERNG